MPVFCDNCGHQNRDGAQFCQGCGGKILITAPGGNLQPGTILDKRYEIKRLLKAGGMGAVYEALDRRFENQPVALKEMLSHSTATAEQQYMIDRFKKEATTLRNLRHFNLPGVIDHFIEAGRYYLVMDYVEGKDLETVLQSYGGKGVPEELVIEWSKQVIEALEYLHNQSPPIIYRDLKPGNIMLRNSDNRIMLVDFGIARTVAPGDTTKTIIGTPAFAPKELFEGKAEERTDLYSLGATMHCLLTGIIPTGSFSFTPVRKSNPGVSAELEKIVMKSLEMDIEARYVSAREMKDALLKISSPSQPSFTVKESSPLSATVPSSSLSAAVSPYPPSLTIPSSPSSLTVPPSPSLTVPSSFSGQTPSLPVTKPPSHPASFPGNTFPEGSSVLRPQPVIPSTASPKTISPGDGVNKRKVSLLLKITGALVALIAGILFIVLCTIVIIFFIGKYAINPVSVNNTPTPEGAPEELVFNTLNLAEVVNGPTKDASFSISETYEITLIKTYHWNNGYGSSPIRIGLKDSNGNIGNWEAITCIDSGEVPNTFWDIKPYITLLPGTYTITDSDPSTWSCNSESDNRGMVVVFGIRQ